MKYGDKYHAEICKRIPYILVWPSCWSEPSPKVTSRNCVGFDQPPSFFTRDMLLEIIDCRLREISNLLFSVPIYRRKGMFVDLQSNLIFWFACYSFSKLEYEKAYYVVLT